MVWISGIHQEGLTFLVFSLITFFKKVEDNRAFRDMGRAKRLPTYLMEEKLDPT